MQCPFFQLIPIKIHFGVIFGNKKILCGIYTKDKNSEFVNICKCFTTDLVNPSPNVCLHFC